MNAGIGVRHLGLTDYAAVWQAMREFTESRDAQTADEIWLTEHAPVYTLGLAGDAQHLLNPNSIPLVKTDRGGQITYHGPGQLVAYVVLDLKRRDLKVRELVALLEQSVIDALSASGLAAARRAGMPGVYTAQGKIAALGLKVKQGCSYHGLSLNVAMDLSPFAAINPCGYAGLAVTQCADAGLHWTMAQAEEAILASLFSHLSLKKHAPPASSPFVPASFQANAALEAV